MTQHLMQYLPPVSAKKQAPPQGAPVTEGNLPPLNLAAADNYHGKKAYEYDIGRETSEKWKAEYAAIEEGMKGMPGLVLDVPCGTGRFFPIYKEIGLNVVGLDISDDMLAQARARDQDAQLEICDISKGIPLPDRSVDVTVCCQFLKFCTEPEMVAVLHELGRVTKSRILCSLFTGKATGRGGKRNWVHSLPVFQQAVREAGFRIVGHAPVREPEMYVWMLERVPSA